MAIQNRKKEKRVKTQLAFSEVFQDYKQEEERVRKTELTFTEVQQDYEQEEERRHKPSASLGFPLILQEGTISRWMLDHIVTVTGSIIATVAATVIATHLIMKSPDVTPQEKTEKVIVKRKPSPKAKKTTPPVIEERWKERGQ